MRSQVLFSFMRKMGLLTFDTLKHVEQKLLDEIMQVGFPIEVEDKLRNFALVAALSLHDKSITVEEYAILVSDLYSIFVHYGFYDVK